MESLATDRKTVWNMHSPNVNACPWHRRCFCQIELVKRSCWSFPPPEIASLPPFSSCPKTVFPRFPLVAEQLTYPSPADISVLYSGVLQTNFGRSHPKNSNWEGKIHCAHVQAKVLYWEQATEAVWLPICPVLRVPVPRSFLHEFLSCLWCSTTSGRQTFGLQLPHASCVSIQRTECADTTKQDAVRRRFKDLYRKSDGRSIYIYIYIYHDSGDVDLLTEASLRLGPTICMVYT